MRSDATLLDHITLIENCIRAIEIFEPEDNDNLWQLLKIAVKETREFVVKEESKSKKRERR